MVDFAGGTRDVYVDFNQLTLRITLEALFGFSVAPGAKSAAAPARPPLMAADALNYSLSDHSSSSSQAARTSLATTDAEVIVAAVAKAFEFFTRRAGSGLMLPEWLPTLDNLGERWAEAEAEAETVSPPYLKVGNGNLAFSNCLTRNGVFTTAMQSLQQRCSSLIR